jgi:putative ABC transport system permease protein
MRYARKGETMFKNYLKIALRNIRRHKGYSIINIAGLAIGMAVCILILLWLQDELSYDKFHLNARNIYRVNKIWRKGEIAHYATTPPALSPYLKKDFPEIKNSTRFYPIGNFAFRYKDKSFYENTGAFVDATFFDIFSFKLLKGDAETALVNPNSIIVTESFSEKYFNEDDPIGEVIRINDQYDFLVTGVLENIPANSHFQFDFLFPFEVLGQKTIIPWLGSEVFSDWHNTSFYTYILLHDNASSVFVEKKISDYLKKHIPESTSSLYLQPLKKIHLYSSNLRSDVSTAGDINYIYIFSAMAIFILMIACFNFINLTTAQSGNRSKEIGLRKVVGAKRIDLIKQFIGESFVLTLLSLILALAVVQMCLHSFNSITNKQLSLFFFGNHTFILGIFGILIFTSIISVGYPAVILSSFQPAKVMKGIIKSDSNKYQIRRILVIFQFFLTIILIISTIFLSRQLNFIQKRNLGYDTEHLLWLTLPSEIRSKYPVLKNAFEKNPDIIGVTASSSMPSWGVDISTEDVSWQGKSANQEILMRGVGVDYDFIETFKIEMIEGRSFSKFHTTDSTNFILNETAIKAMGLNAPIGKQFQLWGKPGNIIGVVKDYHFKSLHNKIEPLLMRLYPAKWLRVILVRTKPNSVHNVIKFLEKEMKTHAPEFPFFYSFVDDLLQAQYQVDQRVGTLFKYVTILAIIISCLGLFSLASLITEQRTKEIGIRKVLGASVPTIVVLLTNQFLKWALIANFIAWPLGYLIIEKLQQFYAYHININLMIFIFSGFIALVVALISVSYQAIKAALANPVESLRYE